MECVRLLLHSLREEVFDIINYLLMKSEQRESRERCDFSLAAASRVMEEEESLYTMGDLKEVS
jgi:hypothetical protein